MNNKKQFTGKLTYSDSAQYELHNGNEIINITKILDKIYYSLVTNQVNLTISDGCKILFSENSILYKQKNQYEMYEFYICGESVEDTLFDNCGKDLEIIIESKALGDTYEKTYISNEW